MKRWHFAFISNSCTSVHVILMGTIWVNFQELIKNAEPWCRRSYFCESSTDEFQPWSLLVVRWVSNQMIMLPLEDILLVWIRLSVCFRLVCRDLFHFFDISKVFLPCMQRCVIFYSLFVSIRINNCQILNTNQK